MLVAIPVMVVPDRAHVAWIGFEEEFRYGVDAIRLSGTDRTD